MTAFMPFSKTSAGLDVILNRSRGRNNIPLKINSPEQVVCEGPQWNECPETSKFFSNWILLVLPPETGDCGRSVRRVIPERDILSAESIR